MSTYLYSFNQYAGFDRVFFLKNAPKNLGVGDLVQNGEFIYLVLGEDISFPEVYTILLTGELDFQILYKSLISEKTLKLINWMVYERYTSYKNVVKLFINQEIEKLITKEIKKSKKGKGYHCRIGTRTLQGDGSYQTLVVFPDLWSFSNLVDINSFEGVFLYSLDTQNKKDTNRWKVKTGNERLICTTSSEIFQDYQNLKKIYFIEPQKRYYASQQDPRYKVDMVVKKIAELHGAEITYVQSEDLYKTRTGNNYSK